MASLRTWARVLSYAAMVASCFGGCSGANDSLGPSAALGGQGGRGGQASGGKNVIGVAATSSVGAEGGAGEASPLCGILTCNPDDALACLEFMTLQQAVLGEGGSSGAGGAYPEGGAGASGFPGGSAGEGGVAGALGFPEGGAAPTDTSGGSGFDGGVGEGAAGGAPAAPGLACRVFESGTACVSGGTGRLGAPCFDSAACAAGFACVSEGAIGRCRPYCCQGERSCDGAPGTYCAERPLREDPEGSDPPRVPVCIDADRCDLGQPPCTREGACECSPGTACQVVRSDGTTSCVPPGTGTEGEACPCSYGFICSQADDRCRPLCRTNASEVASGCGRCQASAGLPEGWGVCIGN